MMTLRTLSLLLFAFFFGIEASAQTGGGNPQNTLLPEINPQDIEIRSEFRASFPGLRRQPILGFNPKPRVFRVDPNRMPFMESKEEAVANISITQLDRPEPPSKEFLQTPLRTNAYIRAGIGRFITPEVEGHLFTDLSEASNIAANLNYRSSEGHLDDQLSSFRYMDADVKYNRKFNEDLSLSSSVGLFNDFNRMYDLDESVFTSINRTPRKDYLGFGGEVTLKSVQNSLEGWEVNLAGNIFSSELDAESSAFSGEINEQVGELTFSKRWAGARLYETFHINIEARGGNYDFTNGPAQQWIDTRASVEFRKLINFSTHISANGGVAYVSDGFSNKIYFVPKVELRYNLKDKFIVTGGAYGAPEMKTVQDHHEYNRFLTIQTPLQHSYTYGAHGEIAFQALEGNRIFAGTSYEIIKDYAYYSRNEQIVVGTEYATFYGINFDNANILEFFGGITQQLVPEKFWFDGRVYFRRPKLTNESDIPFEEKLGASGSLSFKPVQKLELSSWAEYVGKRYAPSANDQLAAFILVNAGVEYQISRQFGVYGKVLNILNQKYEIWDGYQERPLQAYIGITFKF